MGQVRARHQSSAGKNKDNGSTGHGNRYLARVLGEVVAAAARTDTERKTRTHIRQLEALGYSVTIQPAV